MNVIRCEWCGNTYGDHREWCPHCLAPRPTDEPVTQREPTTVFYSDGVPFLRIPEPYGTTERR